MRMAMVGLGKMGANMVRRLRRGGIEVVGYDRSREVVDALAREDGMVAADGLADLVAKLPAPRVVWVMLPAGEITEACLGELHDLLSKGDLVIDGGNTNYHDSQRRGAWLAEQGIEFVDAGTSGGVWGLENGYCLMVGGSAAAIELLAPALKVLAPSHDYGWAHVGPIGAGHFTKMVHNGIEYGMMQAIAEGFALLRGKQEFNLDLAQIGELWKHGSVVRSWLLDLTADALQNDQQLENIKPIVPDSGEGRWTAIEAIDQGQALPVISMSLAMRFASQDQHGYANRLLSMMRNAFGGHAVAKK
ncbi:MAG: decarboxylating 6-phosphogluconate dehydrogenase [Gammaproteobacteria bacterium]|nr:decarboxylating 6-phosphogluconate dehydrogenase [Gammaproteobacteria bacterium]